MIKILIAKVFFCIIILISNCIAKELSTLPQIPSIDNLQDSSVINTDKKDLILSLENNTSQPSFWVKIKNFLLQPINLFGSKQTSSTTNIATSQIIVNKTLKNDQNTLEEKILNKEQYTEKTSSNIELPSFSTPGLDDNDPSKSTGSILSDAKYKIITKQDITPETNTDTAIDSLKKAESNPTPKDLDKVKENDLPLPKLSKASEEVDITPISLPKNLLPNEVKNTVELAEDITPETNTDTAIDSLKKAESNPTPKDLKKVKENDLPLPKLSKASEEKALTSEIKIPSSNQENINYLPLAKNIVKEESKENNVTGELISPPKSSPLNEVEKPKLEAIQSNINNLPVNPTQTANVKSIEFSTLKTKFINDETIFIQLPEDDVELDRLTESGRINLMSGLQYIAFLNKLEVAKLDDIKAIPMEEFMADYYENYIKILGDPYLGSSVSLSLIASDAFASLKESNVDRVKVLVTAYPDLLKVYTCNNVSLFSIAIERNENVILKFLLNLTDGNFAYKDLAALAKKRNNHEAITLLHEAKIHNYGKKSYENSGDNKLYKCYEIRNF